MKYKADLKDWLGCISVHGNGEFVCASKEVIEADRYGGFRDASPVAFRFIHGGRFLNTLDHPRYLFSDQPFALNGQKWEWIS